jgi:hypothetical protein
MEAADTPVAWRRGRAALWLINNLIDPPFWETQIRKNAAFPGDRKNHVRRHCERGA